MLALEVMLETTLAAMCSSVKKRKQNQRLGIFTLVLIMPKTIVCVNCKYKDRVQEREKDKEKMCEKLSID